MTPRQATAMFLVTIGLCLLITLGAVRSLKATRQEHQQLTRQLQTTIDQGREIHRLRGQSQQVALRERPTEDVLAQVHLVLAEAGLPGQVFRSLSPQTAGAALSSPTSPGSTPLREQVMRLTLQDLTPADVGRYLTEWKRHQPLWKIVGIELIRQRDRAGADANSYDAIIRISSSYLADQPLVQNTPSGGAS
jgi:hypothetical protein